MAFSRGIDTRPGSVRIIRTLHIDPPGIDRCRLRSWITVFAACLFALLNQRLVQVGEFIDRIRSADRFILSRSQPWKVFFQQSQDPFNECWRALVFVSHSKLLWRSNSSIGGVTAYATFCSYRGRQPAGKGPRQVPERDDSSAPCVTRLRT